MSKTAISRRVRAHYQDIVGQAPKLSRFYPHPCAFGSNYGWRRGWNDGLEWAAYLFSKEWKSRTGYNPKRLQRIVIVSGNPEVAYLYARDVPGASVDKLEKVVVEAGDPRWMRTFAQLPGARKRMLECYAFLADTMAL